MNNNAAKTGLPIVIIHRNACDYLKHTIAQARSSNPESPIYLISSGISEEFEGVTQVDIFKHMLEANLFRLVYKHLNETGIGYERLCYQRWFILKDFMAKYGIQNCLYIDTDVLLYSNVTEERKKLGAGELAICKRRYGAYSPHCCYVNGPKGLSEFCRMLMRTYALPKPRAELTKWYDEYHGGGHPGGVCDMFLFTKFDDLHLVEIADLSAVIDDATYDETINTSQGYEMENGIKRISWVDGLPYGTLAESGKEVRFHVLHFQGDSKNVMKDYLRLRVPQPQAGGDEA